MWTRIANQTSTTARISWHALWFAPAAIAAAIGAGLIFVAWSTSSGSLGSWGALLLLMAPGMAVLGTRGLNHASSDPRDPPEAVIELLRRAEIALAWIRVARAVVLIAVSYLLVLWLCELGGLMSTGAFLLPYTFICMGSSVAYLPWLARRERAVRALTETRRGHLKAFKMSRGWNPD